MSTFYCFGSDLPTDEIHAFFIDLLAQFPLGYSVQVPNTGDTINDSTGQISGTWTGPDQDSIVGAYGGAYAAGVGASFRWRTQGVVNGHRVSGRTYLVPLLSSNYEDNGTIGAPTLMVLRAAAETLRTTTTGSMVVWSRPGPGRPGSSHLWTASSVEDKVAILRSRRD